MVDNPFGTPDTESNAPVPTTPVSPYGTPYGVVPPGPADMATGPMGGPGNTNAGPMGGPASGPQNGVMLYKGKVIGGTPKPVTKGPKVDIPSLPDFILRQVLSNDNEHNTVANLKDADIMSYADAYAHLHHGVGEHNNSGEKMSSGDRNSLIESVSDKFKSSVLQHLPALKAALAAEEAKYKSMMTPPAPDLTTALATHGLGALQAGAGEALAGVPGAVGNLLMGPAAGAIKALMPGVANKIQETARQAVNPLVAPGVVAAQKASGENLQANADVLKEHPIATAATEIGAGVAPYLASAVVPGGPAIVGMTQMGGGNLLREQERINAMKPEELHALPEYQTLLKATGDPIKAKALLAKASSEAAEEVGQMGGGLMGLIGGGGLTKTAQAGIAKLVGEQVFKRVLATAAAESGGFTAQQVAQNALTAKATNKVTGENREPDLLAGTEQQGIMGAVMGAIGALLHGKGAVSNPPKKPSGAGVEAAPGAVPPSGPAGGAQGATGGAQRSSAGLSPEAQTAFSEALNESKVPTGVDSTIKESVLASSLDDLEARLNAYDVPEAQIDAAKKDFEAQWRKQNGVEAVEPAVSETGEPTPEETTATTQEAPQAELKETPPVEAQEPVQETPAVEAAEPETPPEPEPLAPAESRAEHGAPKLPSDQEIITASNTDVRYPLGLLKTALMRFRNNFKREPTPEELHKEADFILGLHQVDLHDVNRREALGELLGKNPEQSPSRGEITQKAGEYLDPANKRTAQDVINERLQKRAEHPDQQFRNVLKKTDKIAAEHARREESLQHQNKAQAALSETQKKDALRNVIKKQNLEAAAKKPLTDEEQLQRDLEQHREMLALQAERKGNVLRKQTLAEKQETDRVKAKPTGPTKSKKGEAGAAATKKTASSTPKFARKELIQLDRERVKSSGIHSIGYDPITKQLEVKFLYGGGVYRYKGVPKAIYEALMKADSFGKWFNQHIRPTYKFEKTAAFLKDQGKRGLYSLPEGLETKDNAAAKLLSERVSAWHPGEEKAKFETIPDSALPEDLQAIISAFTRTGTRPIFVKNLTPHIEDFEGVAFGDKLLYINENADHPATALITHEFTHDLKQNSPELYKVLEDEVKRQVKLTGSLPQWAENLKKRGYENITDESAIEELVGNGVGDAFSDPKFLNKLAERNPNVFRKIADTFIKFINNLIGKLGGTKNLGSNKYIFDIETFRNKLLDVLTKYDPKHAEVLKAQGTAFGDRLTPKFVRKAPISTAEEAMTAAKEWEKRSDPLKDRLVSMVSKGPDTLEPTRWQKLTRLMSNTVQPLQDYNEHMARQGTPVNPDADLYKSFTILRGRQIFEQSSDHANYIAPILDAVRQMAKQHGISDGQFMGLFSQWIRAKDALNTNKRYELENIKLTPAAEAKRAPLKLAVRDGTFKGNYLQELTAIVNAPGAKLEQHVDPVSGLTNVEAYKMLKAVKAAGFEDTVGEDLNKAFDPLRNRITENQLKSGSFSEQDVRQQRAYENRYYMPKSDWADEDIRVPQKVFGSPLGAFDRMAYAGRETPVDDPIQAIFNKLLFSAKDVADNEATGTLRNAVLDPNQKLGATIRTYDMDKLANDTLKGGKSLANMKKVAAGPRTIIHNRGKFRDVITLPEESQQLRAIKESQAPVPLHGIHKAIAVPTGLYGRFHTALSPSFAMINAVVRDGLYIPGMMVFQGKTDLLPGYVGNYMKYGGPLGAWKAYLTMDGILPKAATFADMEKYAKENPDSFAGELYQLEKAGGAFNFRDEFNNAKKLEKLRDEMARTNRSPLNPLRWGEYLIKMQDAVATGSMMAGRVAAFIAAKEKGLSPKEAAFYSKRLLDYQQTSEGSRILNSWFAFARVGITSVDAMFSALKNEKGYIDPKRAAVGMMVMGVATTGLYAALKSTLGDEKTKKLSDDALAKNVVIPNGTDSPIQLPIGLGMPRLAWGLSMMAVRLAEGDTTAASAARTMKNLLLENVSPLHPIEAKEGSDSGTNAADLAGALVPSIARPGYESFINQTAFGSQIHESPQYTQGYASEAGRLTTGDIYKTLARSLREHTGLDVYPETIRHILSSYDPGAINLLLKNMEKEDMQAAGLEVDTTQATIFAALLNHDLKYATGKEYYLSKLKLEESKKQEDVLKKADKPIPLSLQKQVDLDKEFIKASKEHSKAVKAVTSNTLMSTAAKASKLAAIQKAWSQTQEQLSKQVH